VTDSRPTERPWLVAGLGITGRAVLRALLARGERVVAVDDRPGDDARAAVADTGVELVEAPDRDRLAALVRASGAVVPSPGMPDHHPVFAAAAAAGVPVRSEFDLAARWDDRPLLAVTGTDGKTTVTALVAAMLEASGRATAVVGNTDVPLVSAIDDPAVEVFVVEASSFRLLHSERFAPRVGTWLNLAPDHLDGHATLEAYEAAKARLWAHQGPDDVAIGNLDDPTVARHLAAAPARQVGFGLTAGDYRVAGDDLVGPGGEVLVAVSDLPRAFPHDLSNALAAAATALEGGGATLDGVRSALRSFRGLPHRVSLVGEADGVRYYDDSKATTPHAALAAVAGFESVVLIAGGRNKGLDLTELRAGAGSVRAVVAIGEAAAEVEGAFSGVRPVRRADTMDAAVATAAQLARPGDAVLLSPACASFDRYPGYAARGDDFARAVADLIGAAQPEGTASPSGEPGSTPATDRPVPTPEVRP
jgi:UDP-N-acetylmuramoylalanine--D-glutamate ligase